MKIINYSAVLTEKSGKYVCIEEKRKPRSSHQLVLDEFQGDDRKLAKVKVYEISDDDKCRNYMAFCFEHDGKAVFPVADGTNVKFEVLKFDPQQEFTVDTFREEFLFQWGDSRTQDWQSLKSVAKPNMFLFVEKAKGKDKVTINSVEEPSFRIEKAEEKNTNHVNHKTEPQPQNPFWPSRLAETRTPRNQRATSKDLQGSGIPSKLKYTRFQCICSPGSAKTRARYSSINQRAASKGKTKKNKMT